MQFLRLSLFIFAFSLSLASFCQITSKSQSIQIIGDSTTKDKIVSAFVQNDYSINNVSDYVIKTEFKKIKSWDFDIIVSIVGDKYVFKIYWNSSISVNYGYGISSGPQRNKCVYKGTNGGANKIGFMELDNIVNSLGYPVTYLL